MKEAKSERVRATLAAVLAAKRQGRRVFRHIMTANRGSQSPSALRVL